MSVYKLFKNPLIWGKFDFEFLLNMKVRVNTVAIQCLSIDMFTSLEILAWHLIGAYC